MLPNKEYCAKEHPQSTAYTWLGSHSFVAFLAFYYA
jgi:hypothetical protein